jgi:phage/plasmid primase-like uncharacterized protein
MGKRADRRQQQEHDLREQERLAAERPNEPPPLATTHECPINGTHDFTRKDRDGIRRCWYCAQRKPEAVPA